jgi:hypothetical protein
VAKTSRRGGLIFPTRGGRLHVVADDPLEALGVVARVVSDLKPGGGGGGIVRRAARSGDVGPGFAGGDLRQHHAGARVADGVQRQQSLAELVRVSVLPEAPVLMVRPRQAAQERTVVEHGP